MENIVLKLKSLTEDGGFTLKKFVPVMYRSGWQVATEGYETRSAEKARQLIAQMDGNAGVWFSKGVYYIDKSQRVNTKREAVTIGLRCNQQSIYNWKKDTLFWLI